MESKIFTKAELKELERRKQGNRKDSTGIFTARIKPKIQELLSVWIPNKKELEMFLKKPLQTKKSKIRRTKKNECYY